MHPENAAFGVAERAQKHILIDRDRTHVQHTVVDRQRMHDAAFLFDGVAHLPRLQLLRVLQIGGHQRGAVETKLGATRHDRLHLGAEQWRDYVHRRRLFDLEIEKQTKNISM